MNRILNILNGDFALSSFEKSALPGETLVWREIYTEGPLADAGDLPRFRAARAKFLTSITDQSEEKLLAWVEKLDDSILSATPETTLRLWFDACMFDQSILARILSLLALIPRERRPEAELFQADIIFGEENAFSTLAAKGVRLDPDSVEEGGRCWNSYLSFEVPEHVPPCYPFMRAALERRRMELPGGDGFGTTVRRILEILARSPEKGTTPPELFRALSALETYPWFGDETLWRIVDSLAEKGLLRIKKMEKLSRLPWEELKKLRLFPF